MAFKHLLAALLLLCIAHPIANDRPTGAGTFSHTALERQYIDAQPSHWTQKNVADKSYQTAEQSLPSKPFDLDIPHLATEFSNNHIDQLISTGATQIDLPSNHSTRIQLLGHKTQLGMDHIRADIQGNVVTITRRGDDFFATVAHATGSYRIEGSSNAARIYPHQMIAARTIRYEEDFRHVPSQ